MSVLLRDPEPLRLVSSLLGELSVLRADGVLDDEEVQLRRKGTGKPEECQAACK